MTLQNKEIENKPESCPFREGMDLISGKWTLSIINTLLSGTMRFKDIQRSITGINTRMLAKELRQLETGNVVHRKAYPTVPPMVEYSLTPKGESLRPVMVAIQTWIIGTMQTHSTTV